MTRLILFPNESAQINLEIPEAAEKLAQAVNTGTWIPADETLAAAAGKGLRAVRLGRSVVLAYRPSEGLDAPAAFVPLSPRQAAVLQALAEGLTAGQIAIRLGMARRTVFLHIAAIRSKLNTATTQEALIRAALLGWCTPLPPGDKKGPGKE